MGWTSCGRFMRSRHSFRCSAIQANPLAGSRSTTRASRRPWTLGSLGCREGRAERKIILNLHAAPNMGFNQGRDEELCLAQTGAGSAGRVHRMDAGWSPETFEVCRFTRRQRGEGQLYGRPLTVPPARRYKVPALRMAGQTEEQQIDPLRRRKAMMQRTTLVLTAVLLGLITFGRTELGIAASGIRIGQATPFATLAAEVKFPEGIAADTDGRIYVSTFNVPSFIVKLGPGGKELQRTSDLGTPLLGLAFNAGNLFAADFGNGRILKILNGNLSNTPEVYATLPCCTIVPGFPFPFPKSTAAPNALVFDSSGDLLVSDSFQGEIFRIPAGGCSGGGSGCVTSVAKNTQLATTGFPPFGANGLALHGGALYVANTGNDTVLRLPLGTGGTATSVDIWAESINGADGVVFDA